MSAAMESGLTREGIKQLVKARQIQSLCPRRLDQGSNVVLCSLMHREAKAKHAVLYSFEINTPHANIGSPSWFASCMQRSARSGTQAAFRISFLLSMLVQQGNWLIP